MSLRRYNLLSAGPRDGVYYADAHMEHDSTGEWVKHADVEATIKPLLDWITIDEFASDEMKREAQRLLKEMEG